MNVPFINVEQAQRSMALCCIARQPIALVGGPGCGKTNGVTQFAQKLGAELNTKVIAYRERTDLGGMPYPDEGDSKGQNRGVDWLRPKDLPLIGNVKDLKKPIVLFFDEFDRAPNDVQNATLQFLLGGDLNGHKLAPNVFVVLAMNGMSDMYTTALSEAARNRICTLFMSSNADGNAESYDQWASENDIHPVTRAFMKFAPDVMKTYESFEELAVATPRSVGEFTSKILKAADQAKFKTDDLLLPVLGGLIGQGAAAKFLAFHSRWRECPAPADILSAPKTAIVPKESDTAFAVGISVMGYLVAKKADRTMLSAGVQYLVRLPADVANGILRNLADRGFKELATLPVYQSWAKVNGDILGRG